MTTETVYDPTFHIRTGEPGDLAFVTDLQRHHATALGFMPTAAIKDKLANRQYLILSLRGQPAAYAYLCGGKRTPTRIVQHAVDDQLWRQGYGSLLWTAAAFVADLAPLKGVTLSVRSNLLANRFWRAIGARLTGKSDGNTTRGIPLNLYHFSPGQVHAAARPVRELIHNLDPRIALTTNLRRP